MSVGKLNLLGAAAIALLVVACKENGPPVGQDRAPDFVVKDFGTGDGQPFPEEVELCKYGSAATFDVQMTQPTPPGPTSLNITLNDATGNITNCHVVGKFDALVPADMTVSEMTNLLPAGIKFDSVRVTTLHGRLNDQPNWVIDPPVTSTTNLFSVTGAGHAIGFLVEFFNSAIPTSGGCSYTLGYWKNHTSAWPAGYSPNATFYGSGKSWITVLNTSPRGDPYYILAHQFIAATLNKASGAGVPGNVGAAMTAAAAYFANPGGSTLKKNDLTNLSDLLDSYNNGFQGVAHC